MILPSTPRSPKPPGTRMPSTLFRVAHASSYLAGSSPRCWGSRWLASIHFSSSLRLHAMEAWVRDLITDRYASDSVVYLPTMAMVTLSLSASHRSARLRQLSRSTCLGSGSCSVESRAPMAPCSRITRGTCQMLDTSCRLRMWFVSTWQKRASFCFTPSSSGSVERHASRSGARPRERSAWTECCVGLVFCSPTTPSTGTRLTCTMAMLPLPTLNWNWRTASTKGMDSMSPTVPPSSTTHTSGQPSRPSTGMCETRWIQSMMASVRWGTTCTVLPR
mmetsp:Transcript_11492/g.39964  ORF Transcript_11492/g.39964 Transcript_11492/m.39964 type:complete len:276 (+) Transcript_11492:1467-2294(+)